MKKYKRSIDRSVRELERERLRMQSEEQKLINDMKASAKKNQMDAVKIMAKDLVRTRRTMVKFRRMKAQMTSLSLRLSTLGSTAEMTKAMKGITRTMYYMNKRIDIPEMNKIMKEFMKQNEMMDMKEEMIGDALDDAMGDEEEEEEENDLIVQVLDEIGLKLGGEVVVGDGQLQSENKEEKEDLDLQSRLESLRGK